MVLKAHMLWRRRTPSLNINDFTPGLWPSPCSWRTTGQFSPLGLCLPCSSALGMVASHFLSFFSSRFLLKCDLIREVLLDPLLENAPLSTPLAPFSLILLFLHSSSSFLRLCLLIYYLFLYLDRKVHEKGSLLTTVRSDPASLPGVWRHS